MPEINDDQYSMCGKTRGGGVSNVILTFLTKPVGVNGNLGD